MKLFNSMNQTIEEFKPIHEHEVNMYVCGPTVYNYPHIGNARPIVVFDTLKRTFQALGYKVKMVSNYTDVDDKIIKVAKECGVSEKEITEKFIKAYNDDRLALHAMMPDAAPRVTETMDAIIAFIELLVKKGHAYEIDGDVYFRVNSVETYGKLSNQQIDDLWWERVSMKTARKKILWISPCGNVRMRAYNGIPHGPLEDLDGIQSVLS